MKVYYIGTKHGQVRLSFDSGATFARVLLDELKKNGYPLPEQIEEEIRATTEELSQKEELEITPISSIVKSVVQDIIKIDTGTRLVQNLEVVDTSKITEDVEEKVRKKLNLKVRHSLSAENRNTEYDENCGYGYGYGGYEYGENGYGYGYGYDYGYGYGTKLVVGIQDEEEITQSLNLTADVVLVLYDKTNDTYSLELQLDSFDPAVIKKYEVRLAKVTKRSSDGLIESFSPTGLYIGDLNENQDPSFVEEVLN